MPFNRISPPPRLRVGIIIIIIASERKRLFLPPPVYATPISDCGRDLNISENRILNGGPSIVFRTSIYRKTS